MRQSGELKLDPKVVAFKARALDTTGGVSVIGKRAGPNASLRI